MQAWPFFKNLISGWIYMDLPFYLLIWPSFGNVIPCYRWLHLNSCINHTKLQINGQHTNFQTFPFQTNSLVGFLRLNHCSQRCKHLINNIPSSAIVACNDWWNVVCWYMNKLAVIFRYLVHIFITCLSLGQITLSKAWFPCHLLDYIYRGNVFKQELAL